MTTEQIKQLRDDFAAWTGGVGPENGNEIAIYIESSLPDDLNTEEAVDELLKWMFETPDTDLQRCYVLERARARGYIR
jgi:hypothetical protein